MWNWIKKLFTADDPAESVMQQNNERPRQSEPNEAAEVLEIKNRYNEVMNSKADPATKTKGYEQVIQLAETHLYSNIESVRHTAKRYQGLSYFKLENYKSAAIISEELAKETNATGDWFNTLTPTVMEKDFEKADRVFQKLLDIYQAGNTFELISFSKMCFHYAQLLIHEKQYERCEKPLAFVKTAILSVGITDFHFMYVRGLPTMHESVELVVKLYLEGDRQKFAKEWLLDLERGVDSEGKDFIKEQKKKLGMNSIF